MAIKGKGITARNKDGEAKDLSGSTNQNFGNVHAFTPIPSGYQTAVIKKIEVAPFRMFVNDADGEPIESGADDGKFKHLRLTPTFHLRNENDTIISRQSFTLGAVDDDDNLLQPNPDKDAVWGGLRGSQELLAALKMFSKDEESGTFNLEFHAPAVRNMVVRVMTSVGGYRKGQRGDILPNEMKALLNEYSDEAIEFDEDNFDLKAIEAALGALNAAKGYDEENGYKLKNVIVKIVPMWANKAEEEGLFVQTRDVDGEPVATGRIFVTEADADAYEEAMEHADLGDDF